MRTHASSYRSDDLVTKNSKLLELRAALVRGVRGGESRSLLEARLPSTPSKRLFLFHPTRRVFCVLCSVHLATATTVVYSVYHTQCKKI
jgi:hypothetical protein